MGENPAEPPEPPEQPGSPGSAGAAASSGEDVRAQLGAEPGLCWTCRHRKVNQTRRGTAYLRCTRAEWDERLTRYPRLPVLSCVGYEPRPGE